jgi:hypothetical protein
MTTVALRPWELLNYSHSVTVAHALDDIASSWTFSENTDESPNKNFRYGGLVILPGYITISHRRKTKVRQPW